MEGSLSDMLEREEFEKADLLLDGVEAGQENVEGEESIFSPLVAVHERIKGSESWANYRQNLESLVKDLEDLLDSPNVRTAPANRVRFPDPDKTRFSDTGRTQAPNTHTSGQTGAVFCQRCGAQNTAQAAFCQNCGGSLRMVATQSASAITGAVTLGYVLACLPFVLLPIIFTPAGVGLGIFNTIQGHTGHGIAQIIIACCTGLLGVILGGAGFGI